MIDNESEQEARNETQETGRGMLPWKPPVSKGDFIIL